MTGAPKAETPEVSLDTYALAESRAAQIHHELGARCRECPGLDASDGCATRRRPEVIAGKHDWPVCPMGLLRNTAWRGLVDVYVQAQISPLAGWPDAYSAWAVHGMTALRLAVRREEMRQAKAQAPGGDGRPKLPPFASTVAARGRT